MAEKVGIDPNGVEHLAEKLSGGKHTVFSIAPLTNLALILRDHPQSVRNIERLFVMGARFPEGEKEHNFRYDSQAAQEVLDSDISITIIPSDVCNR